VPLPVFPSRYMPCPDCGASVDRLAAGEHVCDRERRLEFQLFRLRKGVDRFDADLGGYLESPRGRFEAWLAERDRGGSPDEDEP
jgi:hypothetical protein